MGVGVQLGTHIRLKFRVKNGLIIIIIIFIYPGLGTNISKVS